MAYVDHVISFLIITTLLVPSTLGLMFNMGEIGPENQKDIITDGVETYVSTDGIELTTQNHTRAGRATYVDLLHLWDAASGQLADFTTHFSVLIDSKTGSDRFSFFLAHNGSLVNASEGMGHRPMHGTDAQLLPFVAVEFDTHSNSNSNWDPVDGKVRGPFLDHVGINVNSSVEFEKWGGNVSYGNQYFVKIQYDSVSQNLSVFYRGTIVVNQFELRYTVDLRNVLPEWVVFGFSSSSSSEGEFHRNSVKSWFFNSTVLHMDNKRLTKKEKKKIVNIVKVALAFLLLIFVIIGGFICTRKKNGANDKTIDQNPDGGHVPATTNSWEPRRFTFEELLSATDNFSSDRKLGEGGFGVVYKATLTTGEVAVKKIPGTSQDGIRQYEAEVQIVGGARHRHLVRVVGWCDERDTELLIVYELMENLSLDAHLFGSSRESLPWDVRYNIARGLAKAVRYLHNECGACCILHRDLKAGNVLLDSNFEAKLGDFGMVRLLDHDTSQEMSCAGTPGYLDPECFQNGRFSQRSDIYSYGMVVLEIVTGRRCTGFINPDQEDLTTGLAGWVRNKYTNGNIREIVDPRLDNDFDVLQLEGLVALGLWCASRDSSQRPPNMEIVAHILDGSSEQSFSLIPKVEGTGQRSSLETEHTTLLVSSHPPSYLRRAWMFISPIFLQGSQINHRQWSS